MARPDAPGAGRPPSGRRPFRDRRGRGLRGPLAPAAVPLARTRAQRFDDTVLDAVDSLDSAIEAQLRDVEFAVEDVPSSEPADWSPEAVALGRVFPRSGTSAARIVLYRRPIEARAPDPSSLDDLVHDVVVERVAELLGLEPEAVDPDYGSVDPDED